MLSREERARQFLPFDALKGFKEALREKEIEYVEKVEISEEQMQMISDVLNILETGNKVKIIYYSQRQYYKLIGTVQKIDTIKKQLIIDDKKINFVDIFKVDVI